MNVRAERFPLMDSLRGIACLAVVSFHCAFFAGLYTSDSPIRRYVAQPSTAVALFILISGFLLYRPFVAARLAGDPEPATRAYAWRRFLRIVPAYWLALTVVAIWLGLSIVSHPPWHIALFYGFGQIYTAKTSLSGLGQAWTLGTEAGFYLFLPLWVRAMRGRSVRQELIALGGLFLLSVAWKLFATHHVAPSALDSGPWLMPLPNFLDQFAVGMALAVVSAHGLGPRLARAVRAAWPWWLFSLVTWIVICTQLGLSGRLDQTIEPHQFLLRHELQTLAAFGLIVPVVFSFGRSDGARGILAWRPLLYLGLVSYGIYLWHEALVFKIAHGVSHWMTATLGIGVELRYLVLFGLTVAAATAIASVSYYALERPALRLIRLVDPRPEAIHRREALAEPAPATPLRP
jgi:peptidoglycan/LPS O-acetylase OafA/YrhL